jgi:hypothetical protein
MNQVLARLGAPCSSGWRALPLEAAQARHRKRVHEGAVAEGVGPPPARNGTIKKAPSDAGGAWWKKMALASQRTTSSAGPRERVMMDWRRMCTERLMGARIS